MLEVAISAWMWSKEPVLNVKAVKVQSSHFKLDPKKSWQIKDPAVLRWQLLFCLDHVSDLSHFLVRVSVLHYS